jgi:signal transduction histidine kinase/HAMP domain-containing protein
MSSILRGTRLRNRILLWSFVPSTIILFAVAVTIYFAYQRVTENLVVGRNQQLIQLSAGQLAAGLNNYVDTLTTLTRTLDLYSGDPARQSAALSQAANQLLVFDGGVLMLDQFGRVTITRPTRADLMGQDWSDQDFYRQILRSGGPVFTDILLDDSETPGVIAIAVPIVNQINEFRGTLIGMFQVSGTSYSAFYGDIIKLRLGESGDTYLVDSNGRIVYHPDNSRIGEDVRSQPVVQQVLKRQAGYLQTHDLNRDRDILATYAPVPGTPWGLINEENWGDLLLASRGYGQFLYLLLALGVVLPTLVVTFGIKRITDPISNLIAAAKEIAEGKFGQQITVQTGDELEELVTQFNRMSSQLQESYSLLEQRVADRTKELATLNAIAGVASRSLDLKEILTDALKETIAALMMDCGIAFALDQQTDGFVLIAYSGFSKGFSPPLLGQAMIGVELNRALQAGQPLIWEINETSRLPLRDKFLAEGMQQAICVPLMMKRKLVGAFTLAGYESRLISSEEFSLLEAVGQQIGVAVENARLYTQAEQTAAMAERNRLARDLHDAVSQTLFSASLIADVLPKLWDRNPDIGKQKLDELRLLTRGALSEMRNLLLELRPDTLGEEELGDLYRQLRNAFAARTGISVEFSEEGRSTIEPEIKEAFYRVFQESLNNIAKHAGASDVQVSLIQQDGQVEVSIQDNGCGFDPETLSPENLGLRIMRERAEGIGAKLAIQSAPGKGTQIRMLWQMNEEIVK